MIHDKINSLEKNLNAIRSFSFHIYMYMPCITSFQDLKKASSDLVKYCEIVLVLVIISSKETN